LYIDLPQLAIVLLHQRSLATLKYLLLQVVAVAAHTTVVVVAVVA
jgi:hypothetical protein